VNTALLTVALVLGDAAAPPPRPTAKASVTFIAIADATPPGLSDLSPATDGDFWAVPERSRQLVRLALRMPAGVTSPEPARVVERLGLEGVDEGEDTEALAVLDATHWIFGTETGKTRHTDLILVATRTAGGARVEAHRRVDYRPFHMEATPNHGIEALCVAGDQIVAGSESAGTDALGRFAPLWQLNASLEVQRTGRLRLTSAKGKLSALSCRHDDAGLHLVAVERHYEIIHLLEAVWPPDGEPRPPELLADLVDGLGPHFNPEGVVDLGGDRYLLIADNDTGGVRGPTRLALVTLTRLTEGGKGAEGARP